MPILAHEPDCFPQDLFDSPPVSSGSESDDDSSVRLWRLVYSRSRREKDLSRRLGACGVPFYCPTISHRSRSPSGRIREAWVPLFPGYLFVYGTAEDRVAALATNCVSSIVTVADAELLVKELGAIRRLIASQAPITAEDRLEPGDLVKVVSGALQGVEGVVIERRGRRRLLVAVGLMQRGASADLDECDVERI